MALAFTTAAWAGLNVSQRENGGTGTLVQAVRAATERFKDAEAAQAAGYGLFMGCVSGPQEGAMGLHFANGNLVGDGALDASLPEALIYEWRNGRLHLVGVEYLVLAEAWEAANEAPPTLMGQVFGLAFSPDGIRIATASDDTTAKIWDAVTGKELLTLTGHTARIVSAAFSPDGKRLATASDDGAARIWDAGTGSEMLSVSWFNQNRVTDIAFSPGGKYIVTTGVPNSGDISLRTIIWDPATGGQLLALSSPGILPSAIAFSPDGKQLALGYRNGSMKVYGISPDGLHATELFTPRGHSGGIEDITYSPDGKRFATASDDGATKIWDAATGQEMLTLSGHDGSVHTVAFSPDGARLATGGVDGTVRIYLLKIEDLVALAESRLTRTWTTDECQKYLHVEACPGD